MMEYFDFPFSRDAYLNAKGRCPLRVGGSVWRKRGNSVKLIWFDCGESEVRDISSWIRLQGHTQLQSHTFLRAEGFESRRNPDWEYYGDERFDEDSTFLGSEGKNMQRSSKRGERLYKVSDCKSEILAVDIIERWADWSKDRLFMIVKGHYLSYVSRFFFLKPPDVFIKQIERDGIPVGIYAYEFFNGCSQTTIVKHIRDDHCLSRFIWFNLIRDMRAGCDGLLYFGSTADKFKQSMNMSRYKAWRVGL